MIDVDQEQFQRERRNEMDVAIGHTLRRAVGLPKEDDPFVYRWDERGLPDLRFVVASIAFAAHGPGVFGTRPRAIENDLEAIRRNLRKTRNQIAALDSETRSHINRAGDPHWQKYKAAESCGDMDRALAAFKAIPSIPKDQWTVPATLAAMKCLEDALVPVIEFSIEASTALPETGRPPGGAKGLVALIVARYIRAVIGTAPEAPEKPWKESRDPFAVALTEIFDALGLPKGIQRAAEYSTSKL